MASDDELRKKARKIAEEKSDFYIHFVIYIVVNLFLIAIWWATLGPDGFPWFVFPLFGWGIGIAAHGITAFRGEGYIEHQAEKEYQKLKKK
jgi:uncharacterized protein (DUF486 family)